MTGAERFLTSLHMHLGGLHHSRLMSYAENYTDTARKIV
jgi:hypothetical protein